MCLYLWIYGRLGEKCFLLLNGLQSKIRIQSEMEIQVQTGIFLKSVSGETSWRAGFLKWCTIRLPSCPWPHMPWQSSANGTQGGRHCQISPKDLALRLLSCLVSVRALNHWLLWNWHSHVWVEGPHSRSQDRIYSWPELSDSKWLLLLVTSYVFGLT